jgi:tetratricopeptide (TPR) repeat protein
VRHGFVLVGALLLWAGVVEAGNSVKDQARDQMKWGYKAAKRGYWLEALDRFERADQLTPDQPRILNNIAVALEASGRFEEALLTYETALNLAPNDRVLRRNFSQFREFYEARVAPPLPPEEEAESEQAAEPATEEGGDAGDGSDQRSGEGG